MAKGEPATTVAGVKVSTSPGVAVPQFGTKFAVAAAVGTAGKYCVKVTKAATPAIAAIAIAPRMIFPVRPNLNFDFCLFSNFSLPLPHLVRTVSLSSLDKTGCTTMFHKFENTMRNTS